MRKPGSPISRNYGCGDANQYGFFVRAEWWWIDRWRKSTAYICMSSEEQGIYRNLIDTLWLFDGKPIPDEPKALLIASGATAEEWVRSWPKVQKWMCRVEGGWTNDTALEMIQESAQVLERRSEAGKKGATARWDGKRNANALRMPMAKRCPPTPTPTPSSESVSETEEEGVSVEPDTPTPAELPILKIVSETCRDSHRCQEGRHPPIVRLRSIIRDFPDMDIMACARSWSHWTRFTRPKSRPVKDAWGSLRKWIDRDHGDGKNAKTASTSFGAHPNPRGPTPFKSAADHLRDEMGVK